MEDRRHYERFVIALPVTIEAPTTEFMETFDSATFKKTLEKKAEGAEPRPSFGTINGIIAGIAERMEKVSGSQAVKMKEELEELLQKRVPHRRTVSLRLDDRWWHPGERLCRHREKGQGQRYGSADLQQPS